MFSSGDLKGFDLHNDSNTNKYILLTVRDFCERLSPFYQSSAKCYNSSVLQELISCLEQHPDWSLAHVATHIGLPECLKHKKITETVDSSCKDKQRTPLHMASRV